jgi:hypothetical protein
MGDVEQYMNLMVKMRKTMHVPESLVYCCIEDLVLQKGSFMGARHAKSDNYPRGAIKQCFMNAYQLLHMPGLSYCEGFAMGVIPMLHAWMIDEEGNVIDPTWQDGVEYFGIELPTEFVIATVLTRGAYGVLDNMEMGFPLLKGGEIDARSFACDL